jgi:hypothetical protein
VYTSTIVVNSNIAIKFYSVDPAGNQGNVKSEAYHIGTPSTLEDKTAPTVTAFSIPASGTSVTVPVSTFVATDNVAVTGYLLTNSATVPTSTATGWSVAAPTSYTFSGIPDNAATAKTLFAWAKDAAGNVSAIKSATIIITLPDSTKPTVTAFTIPASGTSLTVAVTSLTATDNVAVTGYMLTQTATAPAATTAGWSSAKPANYTFSGIPDGIATAKTLYAWAKDVAGNVSVGKSATTIITLPDVTKPTVTAFTIPASGTSATVAISALTTTDNVAVTAYLLTETATAPLAGAIGWSSTKPVSYTFTGIPDGITKTKTIYAWAKDAAGNVSTGKSATITITLPDVTKPVVSAFSIPTVINAPTVTGITLTASDNIAVTGYLLSEVATTPSSSESGWNALKPINYTFASAGSKTLYAFAKDAAGNVSSAACANIIIDITLPKLVLSTLADGAMTNKNTLNLSGSVTDEVGVATLAINDNAVPVKPDGSFSHAMTLVNGGNQITSIATDVAGNQSSDVRTILLDLTAPKLTVTSPADNSITSQVLANVIGTVDETSTVVVKSALSGPQNAALSGNNYSATVQLENGLNTIDITATDLAGNNSSAKRSVTYDPLKPTLAITNPVKDVTIRDGNITISGTANGTISAIASIVITADGKDYPQAVTGGSFSQTLSFSEEKLYPVVVTVTDEAGNIESITRNIIYTKGIISINGGALYTINPKVTLSLDYYPSAQQIQLYYNGKSWTKPMPFVPVKQIKLSKGDGVKTVIVRFLDSNGTSLGEYSSVITLDTKIPTGSMTINGGALFTNNRTVNLEIAATDVTSGINKVCISEVKAPCIESGYVDYAKTLAYSIGSMKDGKKTIYATLKDYAGKISKPIKASIILDSVVPVGSIVINGGNPSTATPFVTLKLSAEKASEMKFSLDGSLTWGEWEKFVSSKKVVLPSEAGEKVVKVKFRDLAGNESVEYEDSIKLY